MLVYGDRSRLVDPRRLLDALERSGEAGAESAGEAAGGEAGLPGLDRLTRALIEAGELLQGVVDAEFEARGADEESPAAAALMRLAVAAAGRLLGALGAPVPDPVAFEDALRAVRGLPLPARIRCKTPEGYAFYALYPEGYAAAAAALALRPPVLAIGMRSIGASLAATVAARLGCAALTVRPAGHPFHRALRLSEPLRARLAAHAGSFVVVDEGPGLSGSSFGAVADALEGLGAPLERMTFLTSHPGLLGGWASDRHRERWVRARRRTAEASASGPGVAAWFADVVGGDAGMGAGDPGVEDLGGGAWRRDLPEAEWPPAAPVAERCKYRLTGAGGRYLARFVGLGAVGEEKLAVARILHALGFTPEPLALRRGFLLERWVEGTPLDAAAGRDPRFRAHLGRYLGARARALPSCAGDGASFGELRLMAVRNAAELGGAELGDRVERRLDAIGAPDALAPMRIDGRLHAWEWLRPPGGGFCKTDALDHAVGHDLVGPQDVAWDIAGAAVEFDLGPPAVEELRAAVGIAAGREVGRRAVAAYRICYAAFQAGAWSMTGEGGSGGAARILAQRGRCLAALRGALGRGVEAAAAPPAAAAG